MRIGLMLRCIDEKGGIGVYARNLTRELLEVSDRHEYVLFHANPVNVPRGGPGIAGALPQDAARRPPTQSS